MDLIKNFSPQVRAIFSNFWKKNQGRPSASPSSYAPVNFVETLNETEVSRKPSA